MNDREKQKKERRKYVRNGAPKKEDPSIREKRKFIRTSIDNPLEFTVCTRAVEKGSATSMNVSQTGIEFYSSTAPKIGTLISIKIDNSSLRKTLSVNKLVLEDNGEVLGKVVRVSQEPSSERFLVAAAFLTKSFF